MAVYTATITWARGDDDFLANRYSRAHEWRFDGGIVVPASASPHIVPAPQSVAANVDPEEAFVAALSSCHMLFFLSLAQRAGIVVDAYSDHAEGVMARGEDGRTRVSEVTLRPAAQYAGDPPARARVEALHEEAHHHCFIANSVTTTVRTDIVS